LRRPSSISSCSKDTLQLAARECDERFPVLGGGQHEAAARYNLDNLLAAGAIEPEQFECVSFRVVEEEELVDFFGSRPSSWWLSCVSFRSPNRMLIGF
jgi:hypothetical protein